MTSLIFKYHVTGSYITNIQCQVMELPQKFFISQKFSIYKKRFYCHHYCLSITFCLSCSWRHNFTNIYKILNSSSTEKENLHWNLFWPKFASWKVYSLWYIVTSFFKIQFSKTLGLYGVVINIWLISRKLRFYLLNYASVRNI